MITCDRCGIKLTRLDFQPVGEAISCGVCFQVFNDGMNKIANKAEEMKEIWFEEWLKSLKGPI